MNFFWKKKVASVVDPVLADDTRHIVDARPRKPKPIKAIITNLAVFVAIVGSVGTATYFYAENRKLLETKTPAAELESLVAHISQSLELPSGETPTLATVTDQDKLSGQEFFTSAQNGDKVLLYTVARKAILYRPSTGKIVNVSSINVQDVAPAEPAPADQAIVAGVEAVSESVSAEEVVEPEVPAEPARVALYNGSTKSGVTNTLADELTVTFDNVEVVTKEKAAKNDYSGNLVIDLSGQNATLAEEIASSIGGTIGSTLPEGEIHPNTDLLIIAGSK